MHTWDTCYSKSIKKCQGGSLKIQSAIEKVVTTLAQWSAVEAIAMMDYQDDMYDPYFFISLDVYVSMDIPNDQHRRDDFSYTGGFETGPMGRKDRFFFEEIPFRLEYRQTSRFEEIPQLVENNKIILRDAGTYELYRFVNAKVTFDRSGWLKINRKAFQGLPDRFWNALSQENALKMEHYLSDLGAAALREDHLFFTVSSSGFLKSLCSTLYAVNKQLEPSARYLSHEVFQLPILPDAFPGTLDSFLRPQEMSLSRKREIAEIITKKVIGLLE